MAVELAEKIGGEIVNADAFQLYTGLDILTAKPTQAERARVPHHLYDVLPLTEACDAQRYHHLALPIIQEISERGRVPIVVGGSGLYIKALTHGLSPLPEGDPVLRARLASLPLEEKVAQLLSLDPAAATTVPLQNPRYVERALEICLLAGRPQSELRQGFETQQVSAQGVFLEWEREKLYQRINQRVLSMMESGLVEEVAALETAASKTAEKAIGVREARAFLEGQISREECVASIQQNTRHYAKRQCTWFRREKWLQTICLPFEPTAEYLPDFILSCFPCLTPLQPIPSSRSI